MSMPCDNHWEPRCRLCLHKENEKKKEPEQPVPCFFEDEPKEEEPNIPNNAAQVTCLGMTKK